MILVFFVLLFFFGCASNLKDYKPKNVDEEAIKMILVTLESAWNKHDPQGVLPLLHKDAQLMTGMERRIVSKKEYAVILLERMADVLTIKFYRPTISIAGDKASVEVPAKAESLRIQFVFHMIREENKWFIMKMEY